MASQLRLSNLVGFTSADDRRRLEAFMRSSATIGYYEDSILTFNSICTKADEKLFSIITGNLCNKFVLSTFMYIMPTS